MTDTRTADPRTADPRTAGIPDLGLRRCTHDRLVAGVAAGLAHRLDADVTLVRVLWAALVLLGGSGVALYAAAWLLIPLEGSDRPLAADVIDRLRR